MPARTLAEFYDSRPDAQRATAEYLRDLVLSAHPGIKEKIRFGSPFFDLTNWFIYISAPPRGPVELCFMQGYLMADAVGLLEARDRQMVRSVAVSAPGAPSEEALLALIFEAVDVNLRERTSVSKTLQKVQAKKR